MTFLYKWLKEGRLHIYAYKHRKIFLQLRLYPVLGAKLSIYMVNKISYIFEFFEFGKMSMYNCSIKSLKDI